MVPNYGLDNSVPTARFYDFEENDSAAVAETEDDDVGQENVFDVTDVTAETSVNDDSFAQSSIVADEDMSLTSAAAASRSNNSISTSVSISPMSSQRRQLGRQLEDSAASDNEDESVYSYVAVDDVLSGRRVNQPVHTSLSAELARLSRHVWYWGPMTADEACERLTDQPEGTYLVRESCHDLYFFTISFRASVGRTTNGGSDDSSHQLMTLHIRIDYCNGLFNTRRRGRLGLPGLPTIEELIRDCGLRQCDGYFGDGFWATIRLTRPLSRFAHMRSLQHLCHFAIRQHLVRVNGVGELPLPASIRGWLLEHQH
jgi:hypothetical protein